MKNFSRAVNLERPPERERDADTPQRRRIGNFIQDVRDLSDAEIEHVVATDPAAAESLRRNARRCIAKVG